MLHPGTGLPGLPAQAGRHDPCWPPRARAACAYTIEAVVMMTKDVDTGDVDTGMLTKAMMTKAKAVP